VLIEAARASAFRTNPGSEPRKSAAAPSRRAFSFGAVPRLSSYLKSNIHYLNVRRRRYVIEERRNKRGEIMEEGGTES
jgi:hypothetical protein